MARVTAPTTGSVISTSTFSTPLITDYLSQTDTTAQALASDVTIVAGKVLKTNVISETTGATGVTIDSVKLQDGNVELATGKVARTVTSLAVLAALATTFAVTGEAMVIDGDAGGNTIATITGGATGQILILRFIDASVAITDTATHAANSVNLSAAFTSADNTVLTLFFDGTSWFETGRSVNG
jgi:hypothetical protein